MGDGSPTEPGSALQKPLVFNRLLPYRERIEDEAAALLDEIKTNLGRSVLLRQVKPAAEFWAGHLSNYLRLYGFHFSKVDHVDLVRLLLELVVVRDLELRTVQKLAETITQLHRKRKLLSREDLSIDWRPLYELYERLIYSRNKALGMLRLPANMEASLKVMIRSCRAYFSASSTQEMLDEWEPLLCPFDASMKKGMVYLQLFLPTLLPPEHHERGFKLWFEKFITLWQNSTNSPTWEVNLVWLFSRLALNNVGYIDWEPYLPTMFTRFLQSFSLPTALGHAPANRHATAYETGAVVGWITAILGPGSSCQTYLSRLFKTTESFYHPSNTGPWTRRLQSFLYELPTEVVHRVWWERYREPSWEPCVPESHRLSDDDLTAFVETVLPVVLVGMYAPGGSAKSSEALKNLAMLRPQLVIPPLIERLQSSLDMVTEPHRFITAMHGVVAVSRTLVRGNPSFLEGPSHVLPLLNGCLPGIDANDIGKCTVTSLLVTTLTTLVPLVDCYKAADVRSDLSDIERQLCLATAGFEDFVVQLMSRFFSLVESSHLEGPSHTDRETEAANAEEVLTELGVSATMSTVFEQCSPAIFEVALQKLHSFATARILETRVSGCYVASIFRSAARANSKLTLDTVVPHYVKLVLALTESEDVAKEHLLDDELLFGLLILSETVECDGRALLPHVPALRQVLQRTLHLSSRRGYQLAGSLLANVLKACTTVLPLDARSTGLSWEQYLDFANHLPIRDWGQGGDIEQLGIRWHLPSAEELECVRELLEAFLCPELEVLGLWSRGERNLSRDEVLRSLNVVLECLVGASTVLPMWPGEPVNLCGAGWISHPACMIRLGVPAVDFMSGQNVRKVVAGTVRQVMDRILQTQEDDVKSLSLIIKIRILAQDVLAQCVGSFRGSHTLLLDELVDLLTPARADVTHEQFKGALYMLLSHHGHLLVVGDWSFLGRLWPALVGSRDSEKPSIVGLLDSIVRTLMNRLETTQLTLKLPASCISAAQVFAPTIGADEMSGVLEAEEQSNSSSLRKYNDLVCTLATQVESGNLHWRHCRMALVMIRLLIRSDVHLPAPAVRVLVQHLTHDMLALRKREALEQGPDTLELSPTLATLVERAGGRRPRNLWLQYNSARLPITRDQWDKMQFMHKTYIGFYRLPRPLLVYAPESEQPPPERAPEDMSPSETAIFEAFRSEPFVKQLVAYLSLEEKKGVDRFDVDRYYMFKGLFRNFGASVLPLFQDLALPKLNSSQESEQRCALEVLAGLLRGSKHWGFEKMQELRAVVEPALLLGLAAIQPETLGDWGTCMATASYGRDPNKYHWLLELLVEEPVNTEEGSFQQASRLHVQASALVQQEWRICELLEKELERLKPRLTHAYQDVREKMGCLLHRIFKYDVQLAMFEPCVSLVPRRSRFVEYVMPLLTPLADAATTRSSSPSKAAPSSDDSTTGSAPQDATPECKAASSLLQTLCKWIQTSATYSMSVFPPEMFRLVPLLCLMHSDKTDQELQKDCAVALGMLGNVLLRPESIQAALDTISEVMRSPLWHSRVAACSLMRLVVFTNLFTVHSCPEWRDAVVGNTLALLKDERLEVRETAGETLSGLLHCEFLKVTSDLLARFRAQCARKKRGNRGGGRGATPKPPEAPSQLIERHAGIVGLCACINAFPYDVPDFVPDILVLLGEHLDEPPPIPATIKKALSNFRRTHQDSWRDHKDKFTDDQLLVITDLLVSPSYYA
ncbi:proteasome activator complex subunit 4-like [Haemaphysalis longicornis]